MPTDSLPDRSAVERAVYRWVCEYLGDGDVHYFVDLCDGSFLVYVLITSRYGEEPWITSEELFALNDFLSDEVGEDADVVFDISVVGFGMLRVSFDIRFGDD